MDDRFYLRVKEYIRREDMIRPGESVVVGVSGGADSVCLLLVLLRLSREMDFTLQAVHVHHGLRASAEADRKYVEQICAKNGLPCRCVQADAAACAAQWGTGIEEAGRRIRYGAFEETCRSLEREGGGRCRIAVAHHLEDQAETVLFHLCRGTDLRGAQGMLPVSGRIIRPLLEERRGAIEDWLTGQGVRWQTDETNTDTAYTRNYLRAEILPRLAAGVNPAASEHLARFSQAAGEAERYLADRTEEGLARCRAGAVKDFSLLIETKYGAPKAPESRASEAKTCLREEERGCLSLSVPALLQEDPYLRGRILYRCLADCAGTRRDLEAVHIDAVRKLCEGRRDGQLSMPGGVSVLRTGERLFFLPPNSLKESERTEKTKGAEKTEQERPRSLSEKPAEQALPLCGMPAQEGGMRIPLTAEEYICTLLEYDGNPHAIPRKQYTKWFDYDKIGTFPIFRTRRAGDRMTLLQSTASQGTIRKKLARIMLDGKLPSRLRDRAVLPIAGQEALWVPGLRMSDAFRVGPETCRVLQISWEPGAAEEAVKDAAESDGQEKNRCTRRSLMNY